MIKSIQEGITMNNIIILKRDNQKAEFNGEKIAVAIKKGFDAIENPKYHGDDVNHVYVEVFRPLKRMPKMNRLFLSNTSRT